MDSGGGEWMVRKRKNEWRRQMDMVSTFEGEQEKDDKEYAKGNEEGRTGKYDENSGVREQ